MKNCNNCKIPKELSEFGKIKNSKDGFDYICRKCRMQISREYKKTKNGVILSIFNNQKKHSKNRGHGAVMYSKYELLNWLQNDWLFNLLYENFVNCGYLKDMRPSVDRIDDNKGYSFCNIQIMTWAENKAKGHKDMRSGKLIHGNKPQKAVLQFSLDGVFIKEYVSACEAGRQTDSRQSCISTVCNGKRNSANGFIWKFKEA